MSKERELLEKWVSQFGNLRHDFNLLTETKELLAQPEQEQEQEPDYYLWHDEFHEQHPTNEGDPDVYPLYTHPPKREPLSEDEIVALWANKSPANEFECVRLVEKAHGIGVGE